MMDHSPPTGNTRNDSPLSRSDDSLAIRKRRIKAHRKSRAGCLMCKTRKVKVSYIHPKQENINLETRVLMDSLVVL